MRAILAVSKDGYLARGPVDPMDWLGKTDKAVLRILTSCGGKVAASRTTLAQMPEVLKGREMFMLSKSIRPALNNQIFGDLSQFFMAWGRDSWLLGGPKLVHLAIMTGMLDEIFMCHSDRYAFPAPDTGIQDYITSHLEAFSDWNMVLETSINDVKVLTWRRTKCPMEK